MKHKVFTMFSKVKLGDDYIKLYKLRTCMAMQKKVLMICFLFKKFVLGGISYESTFVSSKWDGSHVTIKIIDQT